MGFWGFDLIGSKANDALCSFLLRGRFLLQAIEMGIALPKFMLNTQGPQVRT